MSWIKGFPGQVRDPVTVLIVTQRDKADHIAVEGMVNGEGSIADIVEFREVWGF